MPLDGIETPLAASLIKRLTSAACYAIADVTPKTWFGPQQPLLPQAPPGAKGRQWDYPFGVNLSGVPRSVGGISFAQPRALAAALPLLRAVHVRISKNLRRPTPRFSPPRFFMERGRGQGSSRRRSKPSVADFGAQNPTPNPSPQERGGEFPLLQCVTALGRRQRSIDVIDGATINPVISQDGRSPEPPDRADRRILHRVPTADFSSE